MNTDGFTTCSNHVYDHNVLPCWRQFLEVHRRRPAGVRRRRVSDDHMAADSRASAIQMCRPSRRRSPTAASTL